MYVCVSDNQQSQRRVRKKLLFGQKKKKKLSCCDKRKGVAWLHVKFDAIQVFLFFNKSFQFDRNIKRIKTTKIKKISAVKICFSCWENSRVCVCMGSPACVCESGMWTK